MKKLLFLLILTITLVLFFYFKDTRQFVRIRLLNLYQGASINSFSLIKEIIEEKYIIKMTDSDDYDLVINGVFGAEPIKNDKAIKIFITGEAYPAKLENYDLSIAFAPIDEEWPNYIRIPLYYFYKNINKNLNMEYVRGKCKKDHLYFACFLVSNGNSKSYYDGVIARDHLFYRLSLYKTVMSGGKHLNNIGEIIDQENTENFLSKCKFIIAYENQTYPGYMTEKLFNAYFAGAIPIYYSDIKVQEDINKRAIISAQDYKTEEDLVNYIIEVDKNDKKYCQIWEQPILIDDTRTYEAVKNKLRKKLEPLLKQKIK